MVIFGGRSHHYFLGPS